MNYRVTSGAVGDIGDAAEHYDCCESGVGDEFTDEVQAFVLDLCRLPQKFARVKRYPKGREIRQGLTERFPYIVVYEVAPTEVIILSVTHAAKRSRPWRKRLDT